MTVVTNFSQTKSKVLSCTQATFEMDIFKKAILLCSTVWTLSALSGCAVRPLVLNHVADTLATPGQDLEDDIQLAREASAFYLKLSESVLRETPGNLKLAESVAAGFTQYAYAFVSFEADQLQSKDAKAAQRMKERAARLYARANGHAMTALEKTTPGFTKALMNLGPGGSLRLTDAQVGVAYWAAASWGGLISLSKDDPDKVADLPVAMKLAKLAWETKPDHGRGSLSSLMGTFEAASPGGSLALADKYFDQAIAQSQGQSAGPWVAKAESIALAKNDPPSFERWLKEAIRISDAHRNLENQVMRARAAWLLEVMDDLF
jgi:predicted anti-sigma-YlaC factor YlaD